MKNLLKSAYFWIIFIAFVVSILIIFVSPIYLKSLEPLTTRLFISFVLFFGVIIVLLIFKLTIKEETIKKIKKQRKKKQEEKKKLKAEVNSITLKIKDIKSRFNEAIKIIKNASIYDHNRRASGDLPWYLLVGKSKEGKTELLEKSGLDFPLNINYDKRISTGIEKTKSFQWYFAEHAIFIDMPGEYIEHKKNHTNQQLWQTFLKIFRFRKWSRPINGIILTLSVQSLLNMNEDELEAYGKNLRDRFEEVSKVFNASLPIYLLVTKTDYIDGFKEYFSNISSEDKREVLGITFKDEINSVDAFVLQLEFEQLLKRLNISVLDKIHQEFDPILRAKILLFTNSLTATFDRLKMFIETAFAKTRYRAPLHLRGIYFTSVTQKEQLGYAYEVPAKSSHKKSGMFIFNVLKNIIFPEADMIKRDHNYRKKFKIRQTFIFLVATAIVTTFTIFLVQDFNQHSNKVDALKDKIEIYNKKYTKINRSKNFEEILESLNHIYKMKQYSGNDFKYNIYKPAYFKIDDRNKMLTKLYKQALENLLLPRIKDFIEDQMLNNLDNYNILWNSTKAYLMLNNFKHRNGNYLLKWMDLSWDHLYVNKIKVQQDLNKHWKNFISYKFKPLKLDQTILKLARSKLRHFGQDALIYKQIVELPDALKLMPFQFSTVMGSQVNAFDNNEYHIPGLYTKKGYTQIIINNGRERIKSLIEKNWVAGYDFKVTDIKVSQIYAKVQSSYFRDYKKHWQKALSKLSIPKQKTIVGVSNQLTILTAPESPIYAILEAVKKNTLLYTPAEILRQKQKKSTNKLLKISSNRAIKKAEKLMSNRSAIDIRRYFAQYNDLLNSDKKGSLDLKYAMNILNSAFQEITAIYGSVTPQKDAFTIVLDRIEGRHKPIVMRSTALPTPVSKWFQDALRNDWNYLLTKTKEYINLRYKEDVLAFYNSKLKERYPLDFNQNGDDIILENFEDFFRKGGILDSFYELYVAKFVSFNYNLQTYRFRYIDGSTLPISESYLNAMLALEDIRKNYFNNKASHLGITFLYQANHLGRNLATMELHTDNSYFAYEHGPKKAYKIKWPAESLNKSVIFNIFKLDGNNIFTLQKEGDWALFRVFDQLFANGYKDEKGNKSVILEYKDKEYKVNFTITGDIAQKFSKYNPLRYFKLKDDI